MRMRLLAGLLLLPAGLAAQAPSPFGRCVAQADSAAPATALETCRQALAHYTPLDSTAILARIHFALGDLHRALKQPDSAVAQFARARELYDRSGSRAAAGTSRGRAGSAHFEADRPDSAQAAFREALEIARALDDSANQAAFTRWLGFLARRRGARDTALAYYRESRALYTARGHAGNVRWLNRELGEVHALLRQPDSAIPYLEAALAPGPAPADSATEARTLRQLADLYVESSAPDSLMWARRGELARRAAGVADAEAAVAALTARARVPGDSVAVSNAQAWLGMVEQAGHGITGGESLTREEEADEFLLMGLRLAEGIDLARYETLAGRPLSSHRLTLLQEEGLVASIGNSRLRATPQGMIVLDALVADLAR